MDTSRSDEELDRVVSRRVEHDTEASAADRRAYAAADPPAEQETDGDPAGSGGTADRAAKDLDHEADDEPTRSQ